uniref:Uncharacterized protein n=1 Tax=Salmo trutta TaxID=8032 RepID=A0A674BT70_SALTR
TFLCIANSCGTYPNYRLISFLQRPAPKPAAKPKKAAAPKKPVKGKKAAENGDAKAEAKVEAAGDAK